MLKNPTAVVITGCLTFLIFCGMMACHSDKRPAPDNGLWTAPPEARELHPNFSNIELAQKKGMQLYNEYCWSCHGQTGYGDGAAGHALGQKPANFHDERIRKEPPGALFWKINTGKGNMPSFKAVLTEEQRWELVVYVRSFSRKEEPMTPPRALRPDIKIEHVMNTEAMSVRILRHPLSGEIYYTTFDGDVFRVAGLNTPKPESIKVLSAADHGISRLQGAAFWKNELFLCGNVDLDNKMGTRGRLVRCILGTKDNPKPQVSVVFNTVKYGANKTTYDHGWNALEVSPDGKYIFVNSGARTDHGEVQDNDGLYPNARDNGLTSKIFRFPIGAKDLELPDDSAKLRADGYLYARGIRNAFDMAFDPAGNLFAVVNSSDYDSPEDMFWIREGHHYGFPWIMGGVENPQQYPDWQPARPGMPDSVADPFISPFAHSWRMKYFHTDSTFPKIPPGTRFSPGVQNMGPDANEYRGHSGKILDGDTTGVAVSTFTAHSSPLGLFFDTRHALSKEFNGDGFVIRYTLGEHASMMRAFTNQGSDLLHLHMTYDKTMDNYVMKTTRIVDGFREPTDAILIGNSAYIIEYGGRGGHIWKVTLPGK